MMSGATAELASFASGLDLASVPDTVVRHAKLSVLDTFGCALHGSTLPWSTILREHANDEGGHAHAQVWGAGLRVPRSRAAWLNGTAAHAFEYDDVHMGGMIHVGALTLPSALAVGERPRSSGVDLLAAIVAGIEVGARVGRAVGTPHFAAGYHPQGSVGVFAAAASAGRMAGLSPEVLQQALGIAGSHAAGLMAAQQGAMTKRLHSGHAAQSGVVAALLAERGFSGIPDVLEVDFGGFCSTMGGPGVDRTLLTAELGVTWETALVGFKPYPSCAAAQTSIEAAERLRRSASLDTARIAEVTVHSSTHAQLHSGWPYEPTGVTAAQMSIPYGVARMLISGRLGTAEFTDAAIRDPEVLDLASKVTVVADDELDALGPAKRYAVRVSLHTRDGEVFETEVQDRAGNTAHPMTEEQIAAKYMEQAGPVLGTEQAQRLMALVEQLEDVTNVSELAHAAGRCEDGGMLS